MPTNIKIVVSILTVLLASAVSSYQQAFPGGYMPSFVIGLGIFMALSLWMFPEPKMTKKRDADLESEPEVGP